MKPDIMNYFDYRLYLADFYSYQKSIKPKFSHRQWSEKIGASSPSYFSDIIKGRKNLGINKLDQVICTLQLTPKEERVFRLLVVSEPNESEEAKIKYIKAVEQLVGSLPFPLKKEKNRFFSQWYHPFVLELLDNEEVGFEKRIVKNSLFHLSEKMVDEAIVFLTELNFLKVENGFYKAIYAHLTNRDQRDVDLAKRWQKQMMLLGMEAMDWSPQKKKLYNSATISLSETEFTEISEMIRSVRDHLLLLSESNEKTKKVYQWNTQLFPLNS